MPSQGRIRQQAAGWPASFGTRLAYLDLEMRINLGATAAPPPQAGQACLHNLLRHHRRHLLSIYAEPAHSHSHCSRCQRATPRSPTSPAHCLCPVPAGHVPIYRPSLRIPCRRAHVSRGLLQAPAVGELSNASSTRQARKRPALKASGDAVMRARGYAQLFDFSAVDIASRGDGNLFKAARADAERDQPGRVSQLV